MFMAARREGSCRMTVRMTEAMCWEAPKAGGWTVVMASRTRMILPGKAATVLWCPGMGQGIAEIGRDLGDEPPDMRLTL